MRGSAYLLGLTAAAVAFAVQPATAQTIAGPTGATINSGGPGFGSINDTINQAGLATGYTSGVTNFDAYIAGNPQHSLAFAGNEWFSNEGSTSASVTYDLGSVLGIDAMALWNEDFAGIGMFDLYGSTDGLAFALLGNFTPTDTLNNTDYGPQVFSFSAVDARYFRLDASGCPQSPGGFNSCAIGEVAFRTAATAAVPEPGTWAMMLIGFGAIGFTMRRRKGVLTVMRQAA